jgi:Trk-type K+ transport system membrane component
MKLAQKIFVSQTVDNQGFEKKIKKIFLAGMAFGIQGFVIANERYNSEIRNYTNQPKMTVTIFFLTMFLAYLALMVLATISEQEA